MDKVKALLGLGVDLERACAADGLAYDVNIFQWLCLAAAGLAPAGISRPQLLAATKALLQLRPADKWPPVSRLGALRCGAVLRLLAAARKVARARCWGPC